ncbi:MAG: DsbE family thiol:disulfide interchange protein [Xanthobacteraceae bacterium]|nr:DsbE family thiol:disulfide interchange protein [Xanthobacteraceae bacterium]
MRRAAVFIPLGIFLALAAVFFFRIGGDHSVVPSALIGKPAPQLVLPALEGANTPAIDPVSFKGNVTVVNVWASWCVPCRAEHAFLVRLAKDNRVRVAGVNYKDQPANALKFLSQLGNPFHAISVDTAGRAAIEWGVYGVPETFLVGRDGRIFYKLVGPITAENYPRLLAEIEKALAN